MSCIRQELDRYLAIRRSLGYDLGARARLLRRFAAFAETQGAEHVNTDLFLKWQASFGQASHQTWAARLGMVRLFRDHRHQDQRSTRTRRARCRPRDRRAYDPVGQARQGPAGADRQQRDAAPERLRRRTQPAARLFATPLLCR
jgi:hypothetical protein